MRSWLLAYYRQLKAHITKHPLARIAIYVTLAHLLFLIFAIPQSSPPAPTSTTLLAVKTVRLTPSVKITDRTSIPKSIPPATQPQQAIPLKSDESLLESPTSREEKITSQPTQEKKLEKIKNLKPQAPIKKEKENTKATSKKNVPTKANKPSSSSKKSNSVDSKKLANAMKNLNQVKTGHLAASSSSSSKTANPGSIDSTEGHGSGAPTLTYEEAISQFLRLWVKLPEYGQVKIKLTIDGQGHVVDLKTLAWESEINRAFVEERLPKLIFPIAGNQAQGQANKTFTLVMRNE